MGYRITHPDVENLEPVLTRLWAENLHMRSAPSDKYHWYYRNNPVGPATAFLITSETGETADIVGSCGLGPRTLYVKGKPVRAGLLADFTVDKRHRTLMPALMLQRALAEYGMEHFDFLYAYPNSAAIGVFSRIGYHALGQAGRYVRVLRTGQFVRRVVPFAPVAKVASAVADVGLWLADGLRVAGRRGHGMLDWAPVVDSRFDRFFERVKTRHGVIGERSAAFLRWRFVERLGVRAQFVALTDKGGEIVAYAALTDREPGTVMLADFLALTPEHLGVLLDRVAIGLRKQGYTAVMTTFLGSPEIERFLRRHGFQLRNLTKFIVLRIGGSGAVDLPQLRNTHDWY